MKGELRWRGANSISKFDHHNINGGAVDNTHVTSHKTCKLNLLMRYLCACWIKYMACIDYPFSWMYHNRFCLRPLLNLHHFHWRSYFIQYLFLHFLTLNVLLFHVFFKFIFFLSVLYVIQYIYILDVLNIIIKPYNDLYNFTQISNCTYTAFSLRFYKVNIQRTYFNTQSYFTKFSLSTWRA
jgi:hypothetical protein